MVKSECGAKHAKLALWIIGAWFAVLSAAFAYNQAATGAIETRVNQSISGREARLRSLEISQAETTTKLDMIIKTLDEIKAGLKDKRVTATK